MEQEEFTEVTEKVIPYTTSHPIKRLYLLGDFHSATLAHCEDNLDDAIKTVKNDNDALVVTTGDLGEFIAPDDPRWDFGVISPWLKPRQLASCQIDYITAKLSPIKDKIIGMQWGNHEFQFAKRKYDDVHAIICKKLGTKNLGFSCFLDLIFRRESSKEAHLIRCCGTHGSGNAITPAGRQNILNRWMVSNDAQIYWYAHMHDILHKSREYLGISQTKHLVNKEALGVITGSFFKTYIEGVDATYGEQRNYQPNKIGYPVIEINIAEMSLKFSEKVYLKG